MTLIIAAVTAILLFWIYATHGLAAAIFAGLMLWALILAEGNLHFARVRKHARAGRRNA